MNEWVRLTRDPALLVGAEASRPGRPDTARTRRIRRPTPPEAARPAGTTRATGRRAAADPAGAGRPKSDRSARAGRGRADDHPAVRIHADGLGLDAGLALHGEVHDAPLVGEHRLERHGLAGGLDSACDALRDLAQLILAPVAVALDIDRHVHGVAGGLRGDRGHDLLQRDEVLAAAADECAELGTFDVEAFHAGTAVEGDLGLDAHLLEQRLQDLAAGGGTFGTQRRGLLGLVGRAVGGALGGGADRVRAARHVALIDDRLGLLGPLLLGEREEHARVHTTHAEHVRGLAPLQDLDVDVGTFASELQQSALDRLFDGATGELFSPQRHRYPPSRFALLLLFVAVPLASGLAGVLRSRSIRRTARERGLRSHVAALLFERRLLPGRERAVGGRRDVPQERDEPRQLAPPAHKVPLHDPQNRPVHPLTPAPAPP